MVELALVLSLLMMLLVGSVTSALAFGLNNSVQNAAREASRFAATLPAPADIAWLRDVRDVTRAAAMGNLDASVDGQYICVAHYDGSTWARLTDSNGTENTASSECVVDGLPADQARTQVVARRTARIHAIVFSKDVTVEGVASSRYAR